MGYGSIAGRVVPAVRSAGQVWTAVAGRDPLRARGFSETHAIARVHASCEALFEDPDVDVVYIATPHTSHAALSCAALRAGKGVLCEKPFAVTPSEAREVLEAARETGRFFVEGWMYRFHPLTAAVCAQVAEGRLGEVTRIEVSFGAARSPDAYPRLYDPLLGGGALLDLGGYPLSYALLLAKTVLGEDRTPSDFRGEGLWLETGVDTYVRGTLGFGPSLQADIACSIDRDLPNSLRIVGSEGTLWVPNPWTQQQRPSFGELHYRRGGAAVAANAAWELERWGEQVDPYTAQALSVAKHFDSGFCPEMTHGASLELALQLAAWRQASVVGSGLIPSR